MARDIAVIVVHGIRTKEPGYSNAFRERVATKLPKALRANIEWREVFWADIVRDNQQAYFQRAKDASPLRWKGLRRDYVLEGLGDAAAYSWTPNRTDSSYHAIQARVTACIDELDEAGHGDRPLVFVAHSLGCHIASSYIWDRGRLKSAEAGEFDDVDAMAEIELLNSASPFRRLDTLAGFITFGSNQPILTFAYDAPRVKPITLARREGQAPCFPGAGLDQSVHDTAKWLNFYSPFDILGYPLRPLNEYYAAGVEKDQPVWSGGPGFLFPGPAHTGYWSHPKVVGQTARLLRSLAEAP